MSDTSIQSEHEHFSSVDGENIFYRSDVPQSPKANILLVHGFAEHCGRYDELAQTLVDDNYAVFRFDLRGHGRSDGKRGHIFAFEEYLQDFFCFKEKALAHNKAADKTILIGHSYGGLVSLSACLRDASDINAVVLSSPFFGVAEEIPRWKVGLGRLLSKYLPTFSLPTNISSDALSHDPKSIEAHQNDTLIGHTASTRWLTETLSAQSKAVAAASTFDLPILWQQSGEDKLVCKHTGRQVFDELASADKTWIEYENMYHEIYFELDRQRPISDLHTWLNAQ